MYWEDTFANTCMVVLHIVCNPTRFAHNILLKRDLCTYYQIRRLQIAYRVRQTALVFPPRPIATTNYTHQQAHTHSNIHLVLHRSRTHTPSASQAHTHTNSFPPNLVAFGTTIIGYEHRTLPHLPPPPILLMTNTPIWGKFPL
jgi:hypothetical protein